MPGWGTKRVGPKWAQSGVIVRDRKASNRNAGRGNLGAQSEVRVKRFEGHHGTGTFRPKVKGWE